MEPSLKQKSKPKELRKFGLSVGAVFILLFGVLLPLLFHRPWPRWPWYIGSPLILLGLIFPSVLGPVHKAWMTLGHLLNYINSRIILGIVFFLIFTPIALVLRLLGKDPLHRKWASQEKSYRSPLEPLGRERMERPY